MTTITQNCAHYFYHGKHRNHISLTCQTSVFCNSSLSAIIPILIHNTVVIPPCFTQTYQQTIISKLTKKLCFLKMLQFSHGPYQSGHSSKVCDLLATFTLNLSVSTENYHVKFSLSNSEPSTPSPSLS